jgi:hypothetical protein
MSYSVIDKNGEKIFTNNDREKVISFANHRGLEEPDYSIVDDLGNHIPPAKLTCATCKFFDDVHASNDLYQEEVRTGFAGFGVCSAGKFIYMNAYRTPLYVEAATDQLVYSDGDGLDSMPIVGKDFGCVHHKNRDNPG